LVFLFHFHDASLKLENWFELLVFPADKAPYNLAKF